MKHMAAILQALSLNNLSSANIGALLALPVAMAGLDDRCYVGCSLRLHDKADKLFTLLSIQPAAAAEKSAVVRSCPTATLGGTRAHPLRMNACGGGPSTNNVSTPPAACGKAPLLSIRPVLDMQGNVSLEFPIADIFANVAIAFSVPVSSVASRVPVASFPFEQLSQVN